MVRKWNNWFNTRKFISLVADGTAVGKENFPTCFSFISVVWILSCKPKITIHHTDGLRQIDGYNMNMGKYYESHTYVFEYVNKKCYTFSLYLFHSYLIFV